MTAQGPDTTASGKATLARILYIVTKPIFILIVVYSCVIALITFLSDRKKNILRGCFLVIIALLESLIIWGAQALTVEETGLGSEYFADSLYFFIVSMLTIGYGDMSLKQNAFRFFFVFLNIPVVGMFVKFSDQFGQYVFEFICALRPVEWFAQYFSLIDK